MGARPGPFLAAVGADVR